jgi:hypothetical protein
MLSRFGESQVNRERMFWIQLSYFIVACAAPKPTRTCKPAGKANRYFFNSLLDWATLQPERSLTTPSNFTPYSIRSNKSCICSVISCLRSGTKSGLWSSTINWFIFPRTDSPGSDLLR